MSQILQIKKCKNIYCNNPATTKARLANKDDFCWSCLQSNKMPTWRCGNPDCDNTITSHIFYKKYCSDYCRQHSDNPNRRERARLKRIEKLGVRTCLTCGGQVFHKHKKRYCTVYCRWLGDLKRWNKTIKEQMELARC